MGQTILVVEDNPATRRMVAVALGARGHRVLDAPDGKTALELAARERPSLVLQDLILPDVDGFALVGELRRHAGDETVVLAFSGFTSTSDEARISAVGFDDVIIKPIEPSRLTAIVEAHLPAAQPAGDRFGRGKRLVLADDDPVQLKLTRFRLEKLGFQVETAGDGAAALALIARQPPDVVVSDVLMPNLDGFGLALAVRQDPRLEKVPLLLLTSSYVDESDRELARRAGAHDLVLRTPEQKEMVTALRALLSGPRASLLVGTMALADIERERTRRVVQQLERHVLTNAGLARRCSALSAELAVLAGISEAVLKQENVEQALDEALAACFDAGGISGGAIYLLDGAGAVSVRPLGTRASWQSGELESFFGQEALLRALIVGREPVRLPSPGRADASVREMLARSGANAAMVVPLIHVDEPMGALFMLAQADELEQEDWNVFAYGVGNQIAQALALARAFSRREVAERQALESQAEWRALAENAPDTIMRLDREGVVRFVNRATGPWTPEEILGKPWLSVIPPEYHPALSFAFERAMTVGEASNHEIMLPAENGYAKAEWLSSRIGPIAADGEINGAIVISRQITQKKQQEAQLIVSDRMASVGTLAAGVAHEINNPLAAVIANLDLACRDAVDIAARTGNRDLADYLQDAQEAAERVRLIVRDLKVFSRAEEDRGGPTDLRAVLESTLRMAWNEIRHRARLVKDLPELPAVEANESRLGQVFLNLIINASHAIPEGQANQHQIRIAARRESEGTVAVDVTDTGTGMSDDVQRRLFTPFFTTKPVGIGTGLGLSICQRLITGMGGEIRVRSAPGLGSTFTVVLPVAKARIPAASGGGVGGPSTARRRGRVLMIDDELVIATAVQRSLNREHDVTISSSAQEALALLLSHHSFDVVLCDLMMPEMTGMDLHATLLKSLPEVAHRIIFVTGGAFTARAREFLERVPNLHIDKPFNVQQLRALVNERLR